jgi:sugar fermentation stimulation protein A
MKFPVPLVPATLIRRYKRFLADVRFADGSEAVAHCADPGAMLSVARPGAPIWLLPAGGKNRKLAWSWALADIDGTMIGTNTSLPNRLAEEAIRAGTIPELAGYETIRREVKYGLASRVDLVLAAPGRPDCYVEVKNVHLCREPGLAEFPDCVTQRGAKHLEEMAGMVALGMRAVTLYIVQRADCTAFRPAADLDPGYARGFRRAVDAGMEVLCYACHVATDGIAVAGRVEVLI